MDDDSESQVSPPRRDLNFSSFEEDPSVLFSQPVEVIELNHPPGIEESPNRVDGEVFF